VYDIAVRYQMYHALALLAVGLLGVATGTRLVLLQLAGWAFASGTLAFSGSLYLLSLREWLASDASSWLAALSWLGPVTPLGGALLIAGWILLALSALRLAPRY
jgi:uncharacterized membrane protein YgdD (TMEM256/DUF423 family)